MVGAMAHPSRESSSDASSASAGRSEESALAQTRDAHLSSPLCAVNREGAASFARALPRSHAALGAGHDRGGGHRGGASYVENIGLYDYIFSLPAAIRHYLFSFTPGCVACFASLCELDRLIVLRLLFIQQHVSERAMRLWVAPGSAADLRRSLQRLVSPCRMLVTSVQDSPSRHGAADKARASSGHPADARAASPPHQPSSSGRQGSHQAQHLTTQYSLAAPLKQTLLQYVLGGPSRPAAPFLRVPAEGSFQFPTKSQLVNHSRKQWDALLRFIVEGERGSFACSEERGGAAREAEAEETRTKGDDRGHTADGQHLGTGKKRRKSDKLSTPGPCEDLVKVLSRRRLLCRRTKSRRSLLALPTVAPAPSVSQAAYGGPPSPTAPTSAAAMSREAFSWILKDLKSQVNSLVVEFLFLLDGGVLTNAAHDAGGRSSGPNSAPASGGSDREKSSSCGKRQAVGQAGAAHRAGELSKEDNREGGSANRIEAATNDMKEVLLLILALGQSSVGQPISVRHLSSAQRRFITFAINIGLVWAPPTSAAFVLAAPYALLLRPDKGGYSFSGTGAAGGGPGAQGTPGFATPSQPGASRGPPGPAGSQGQGMHCPAGLSGGKLQEGGGEAESLSVLDVTFFPLVRDDDVCDPARLNHSSRSPDSSSLLLSFSTSSVSSSPLSMMGMEAGMLVQSNFKVYVYTASALQLSVLSHLCELQARMPNLIVGILTRASVLAAYKSGITADQIIRFLEAHAHPVVLERKLRTNAPLLPENVTIQLRMWEAERMRLSLYPAVLLKKWDAQFMPELFQRSVRWAVGKNFAIYFTPWPEDPNSEEFREWMQKEKYLAIHADYKPEMVEKIRDVRDSIIKQQAGKA
ncbi:general transcription factor IIH polypeptide 4 GTF2H4 [Toxoplasma gondii GT1]|uniref:General transcription factor IIH subunit 4 n=5 Tax=Toxoplasma gondii TaxID=5811 RepID=A0A125YZE6_TOXGV|nr:general transcription factor IIH polypeptide 4 GTF2H4 [Toxoplasma gondii GT1]ESS31128.1 general transcription factor IIH polypeptide 4 GTF2H4 [Toxoplasma gondii VEG]KAF4640075.1 general transcription factor IIH polypeptide 4 GTF2H4 [Toxoplasma gondii]